MRKRGEFEVAMVLGVVVAEDHLVMLHVLISVCVALHHRLDVNEFSEVEHRAVQQVDLASDETDIVRALIIGYIGGMDNVTDSDSLSDFPKVVGD
jgi:hypothetical protein